jgi:NTE family protein
MKSYVNSVLRIWWQQASVPAEFMQARRPAPTEQPLRKGGGRRVIPLWCSAGLLATLGLIGCYPVNPPLARYDPDGGYRYTNLAADDPQNSEATFVALTFSGGGTRAAAFAYGVLDELRQTDLGNQRTLLDEVDVISSVSGGSFTSAYLGLFGQEALFRDFPEAVLYRKIEYGLALRVLAPWNWPRLLSPNFGRGDLADEYYDNSIFQGRRFADLPRKRPFIILNATDIVRGAQFSFTQEHFDRLCSDLSPVHVSRGVTASSAFPVGFTPLTLKNYDKEACGYHAPLWVELAGQGDFDANPQRYALAQTWRSYEDAQRRRFIHLSDGGLSDNIGLRAIETAITSTGSLDLYDKVNDGRVTRVVVIVVDAKPRSEACADQCARPPGIFTVLNAAATNPMENYSSDTVERVRQWFKEWNRAATDFDTRRAGCNQLATQLCEQSRHRLACGTQRRDRCYEELHATENFRPPHPKLYLLHVRFDAIPDETVKQQLQGIGTRLQIPKDQVDLLIVWARRLLHESPTYQRLVADLRAQPTS